MYPRNAASPERIAIGPVVQISDGAVQTSGVSVKVLPQGGTASAATNSPAYEEGIVHYTPTQAETNYASFILIAYKTGCIPATTTIVTSASATTGYAGLDWAKVSAPTTTLNLSGTTISTAQKVDLETIKTQAVTAAAGVTFPTSVASPTNITAATGVTLAATTGLGNQTANITGNLSGSVGSVTGNVGGSVASVAANGITATSIAADAINAAAVKADAVTKIQSGLATPTNITAGTITTVTTLTNPVTLANGAHGGAAASLALGAGATISNTDGHALTLTGGTNGHGLLASGAGTGSGLVGSGGSGGGHGMYVVGDAAGMGIYAVGGDGTVSAGMALVSNASLSKYGLLVEDGVVFTNDAGVGFTVSSSGTDQHGMVIVGNGTGGDLVADITGNITSVTTATNVTTVNGLANGVITAAAIATDAIDADALATDAVTEINTAVLSAISGIGTAGGAAINVDMATDNVLGAITGVTSGTTFLGTQSSGTFANTSNVNGVYHVITGTADGNTTMDIVGQFLTGAGTTVVQATWVGYVTGTNDIITISAWRHDTGAWESVSTITGTLNNTTIQTKNITLYARHRGTSAAELGKVYLRLHCTGMTTPVVGTDQFEVSYAVTSRGTYSDGAVWINTNASNTNTQSYVDGLPENPVSTIAAAITIAGNLNLSRYRVANGSSITLAADHISRSMIGRGYALALGTQNISGSYFEGVEGLSGTATCPTAEAIFLDCHINAVTIGEADFVRCHLMNTITLSQASVPYRFHDCSGITSAKITFAAASQSAVVSRVSGVLTIAGMVSTNTLYLDGDADVTFDATNNTGTVYIAGNIRLTNNGTNMAITDTARWSEDQSVASVSGNVVGSIGSLNTQAKADVNAEVDAALNTAIPGTPTADSINERIVALDTGVNITRVNNFLIDGSGTELDPWGPAPT